MPSPQESGGDTTRSRRQRLVLASLSNQGSSSFWTGKLPRLCVGEQWVEVVVNDSGGLVLQDNLGGQHQEVLAAAGLTHCSRLIGFDSGRGLHRPVGGGDSSAMGYPLAPTARCSTSYLRCSRDHRGETGEQIAGGVAAKTLPTPIGWVGSPSRPSSFFLTWIPGHAMPCERSER